MNHRLHRHLLPRCFGAIHHTDLGLPHGLPPSSTFPLMRVMMSSCPVMQKTLLTHALIYPVWKTNWIVSHRPTPHLTLTSHSLIWHPSWCRGMLQGPGDSSGNGKTISPTVSASKAILGSRLNWMCQTHPWRSSAVSSPMISLI